MSATARRTPPGEVRIIGGACRRRRLAFPATLGLRPTPDRVRETVFNWLGQDLSGRACLDLFAGSGALGFEAASRGAARVVLVEREPAAIAALRANAAQLALPGVEIVRADALQFAASSDVAAGFDVLFLDPPYRLGCLERIAPLLPRLMRPDNPDAAIYVEAERVIDGLGDWRQVRQGRAGQVCYHLLKRSVVDAE